jgi:hypothetical protein
MRKLSEEVNCIEKTLELVILGMLVKLTEGEKEKK